MTVFRPHIHNLQARSRIVAAIRAFFAEQDFLEVTTPVRIPAPAPEVHINPVPSGDWFLQTSPELCMKRLLAAGLPRIYQICPCFRAAERGDRHLPEFTMLEWYGAGMTCQDMMVQTGELIRAAADAVPGGRSIRRKVDGAWRTVDLSEDFDRITVADAFARWASLSAWDALNAGKFDECLSFEVEPHLGLERPAFLLDYPAPLGALARKKPDDPHLAERFELYIAGMEICNAFGELTDPAEQRMRFAADREARNRAGKPVWPLPEAFLSDLEHMPDAAGNALGLDRLVMLLTGAKRIDDVVCFTP
ncbi:MAG: EF-P lysine aminoacylase GenX [Desulfobacterales bacterium]|nr:MAG: EF-P lysine aminoacylase GenX [Desulfobacterales bacterium]